MPADIRPEQYKYVCARHVILAHAKAYRLFKKLNIRQYLFRLRLKRSMSGSNSGENRADYIEGQIAFKNDDFL